MFVFQPAKSKEFAKCCWYESAMSAEQCDAIIKLFDCKNAINAGVHVDSKQDDLLRKSEVNWLHNSDATEWIFQHLTKYVFSANNSRFHFQLSGFYEALQLTKYGLGGHYIWHEDNMEPAFTTRKLSVVVQLTDPKEYEGGELVLFPNTRAPRTRGTITIFPSFVTHKVEPVKQGTRYSLVGWVTGEAFK